MASSALTAREATASMTIPSEEDDIYSCVFPAPNPTGELHMGHGLNLIIQDVLCRWQALQGKQIFWLGALDHGSFSTQTVVERQLREQGQVPENMQPQALKHALDKWIETISPKIYRQMRDFDLLMDLQQPRSMSDPRYDQWMSDYLIELFQKGLIYRKKCVEPWCVTCQTSVDDVDQVRETGIDNPCIVKLPIEGEPALPPIEVSFASPEIIPACVAILLDASNPNYQSLFNKTATTAFRTTVKLIPWQSLPPNSQGGAFPIVPGHCRFSQAFAKANQLPFVSAFDQQGKILLGPFKGFDRQRARAASLQLLRGSKTLVRQQAEQREIPTCRKCYQPITLVATDQWYWAVTAAAQKTLELLENNEVVIYPKQYHDSSKVWLKNLTHSQSVASSGVNQPLHSDKDLCLSRQILCGNSIPAWRCDACANIELSTSERSTCACGGTFERLNDVLDMKFSCAFWAFCANRTYTEDKEDIENNSALTRLGNASVCVTGVDLLYFWIIPVLMLSTQLDTPRPFRKVVIHPLIADGQGRKMSKSLGNVVQPNQVIECYGVDCFRLSLLDGLDPRLEKLPFSEQKLKKNAQLLTALTAAYQRLNAVDIHRQKPQKFRYFAEQYKKLHAVFDSLQLEHCYDLAHEIAYHVIEMEKRGMASTEEMEEKQLELMIDESIALLSVFIPGLPQRIKQLKAEAVT